MSNSEDLELILAVAKGDSISFESLMLKYQKLVYGYCVKMLKDRQRAEDVTQDTWIRVVKNAGSYKRVGSVKSWILSISRNLIIDEFRLTKKWIYLEDEDWNKIEDTQEELEKLFVDQQNSERLHAAFDLLPENQKVILSMVLIEELNQSEVAQRTGISVGAVKATLFRARESLKKTIGGSNE